MSMELDELFERQSNLEERIANFFNGGEVYSGDRGYQDLLEQLDEVEEQINDLNDE